MSNTEPTEVKNKFKFGGVEYKFATDTVPEQGSTNLITSGAISDQLDRYSCIRDLTLVQKIADGNQNVPTSDAVWKEYHDAARLNTTTNQVSTNLRHNIFQVASAEPTEKNATRSGQTWYYNKKLYYYYDTDNPPVAHSPQKYILYYNLTDKKLCYWTGSSFTNITL